MKSEVGMRKSENKIAEYERFDFRTLSFRLPHSHFRIPISVL